MHCAMNMIRQANKKVCFIFPGQLLELPYLDTDVLRDDTLLRDMITKTRKLVGFEWSTRAFQDPALNKYVNLKLQILSYLISVIYCNYLKQEGIVPDVIGEHSMGIYAALVASGVFTFEEGLELVFSIGLLLEQRAEGMNGAMASIIGLTEDEIHSILERFNSYRLFIANYNGSRQFVLSGEREGIKKTIELALDGYRAIAARELILNVPLHCELIEVIKNDLITLLSTFNPKEGTIPVINHLTADICKQKGIRQLLCEGVYKPVLWDRCVQKLTGCGTHLFIEVGYGETLCKLIRWIDKDIPVLNIDDKSSVEKIKRKLKGK